MQHNKKALQQIKETIEKYFNNNTEVLTELNLLLKDLETLKILKVIIKANDIDDLWLTKKQIKVVKKIKNN